MKFEIMFLQFVVVCDPSVLQKFEPRFVQIDVLCKGYQDISILITLRVTKNKILKLTG